MSLKNLTSFRFKGAILGVTLVALFHILAHLFYGSYQHVVGFVIAEVVGLLVVYFIQNVETSKAVRIFKGYLVFLLLSYSNLLPPDQFFVVQYIPFILVYSGLSRNYQHTLLVFYCSLVVTFVFKFNDIVLFNELTKVPSQVGLVYTCCASIILILFFTTSNGNEAHEKLVKILNSAEKLKEKELQISNQQKKLDKGNKELQRINSELEAKAEEEQKIAEELSLRIEDQEQIVHAIHHDLKEPLRNIISFNQLLMRKLSKKEESKQALSYLQFAIDGGHRMSLMLNDLLLYSKSNDEEMTLIDLNVLTHDIKQDLSDSLERHTGKIEISPLPKIMGYHTQIRQLLQNLIANSLKFSRKNVPPVVSISFKRNTKGEMQLVLRDNGIGIQANRIDEIFGLFNRANVNEEYEGSGVGLALCKLIAITHGASISLTSEVGVGTVFYITGLEIIGEEEHSFQTLNRSFKSTPIS